MDPTARRPDGTADPDGEWLGSAAQVFTQRQLFKQRHRVDEDDGLVSQGRTLMIMDGGARPYVHIVDLIGTFHRVLIFGEQIFLRSLAARLGADGMNVQEELHVLAGPADLVAARLRRTESEGTLPAGWRFDGLRPDSPAGWVAAVQTLHVSTALAPLPGWFLRGLEDRTRTVLLRNDSERIVGSATALRLSSRHAVPPRLGMVLSVCLEQAARGRRLSPMLNLKALSLAINEFGSEELWEIVESGNAASFAMNARSGLSPTLRKCLFVEPALLTP